MKQPDYNLDQATWRRNILQHPEIYSAILGLLVEGKLDATVLEEWGLKMCVENNDLIFVDMIDFPGNPVFYVTPA